MARLKQIQRVREEIYQKLLLYPSLTPTKIAEEFGVSRSFVSGLKAKSLRANDHNLMETSTGLFLTEFQICQDRLNSYITELENLKKTQKRIVVDKLIELVPLDAIDLAVLMKLQVEATKTILMMIAQPRLITVIRAMRDQKLKKPKFDDKELR
jgi:hypothetical protein